MAYSQKNTYILRLVILAVVVTMYFVVTDIQVFVHTGFGFLKHRDFENFRLFILSYGILAPLTSIVLMALQSVIPLVPGLVVTIANAWIFGWIYGSLYSWIGALLGAILDFGIARWYGRPLVEKIISFKYLELTDSFFKLHGVMAVFITRIVPVIPFKVISYSAGLTAINFYEYTLATAIGQTPGIILYSLLGQNLRRSISTTIIITTVLICLGVLMFLYRETIEKYLTKRS